MNFRPQSFSFLPPIIKNLLIINGLAFFAAIIFQRMGINLLALLGLYIPQSDLSVGVLADLRGSESLTPRRGAGDTHLRLPAGVL